MRVVRDLLALAIGLALGMLTVSAWAQAPAAPTCESQLDAAQSQVLQLKKEKAQAEFQAAAVEEYARSCKKQLEAAKAKPEQPKVGEAMTPKPGK